MDDEKGKPIEEIQRQIDATKASLVEKLGALETHVSDSVQATTDSVSETVNSVKETVESITGSVKETVDNVSESVKETFVSVSESVHHLGDFFDIQLQAQRRPWTVVGVAIATGCLASYLLGGKKSRENSTQRREEMERPYAPPLPSYAAAKPKEEARTGWLWDSVSNLSGLAIGSMMGIVRDMAVESLPEVLGKKVMEEVDRITTHLGGKPLAGPLLTPHKSPTV